MNARNLAIAFGAAYLVIGVVGFIPGAVQPPPADAPALAMSAGYGYLFGVFPINVMHNIIHLVAGVWGIAAGVVGYGASRLFGQVWAVLFGLMTVMGFIPGAETMWGMAPLFGADIALHVVTAIVAAYIGWFALSEMTASAPQRATTHI
jgi:hypothetical protein